MTNRPSQPVRRAVDRLRIHAILLGSILEESGEPRNDRLHLGRPIGLAIQIDHDLAIDAIADQLTRDLAADPIEPADYHEALAIVAPEETHPKTRHLMIAAAVAARDSTTEHHPDEQEPATDAA